MASWTCAFVRSPGGRLTTPSHRTFDPTVSELIPGVQHFGADRVAEVTGRSRRIVARADGAGDRRLAVERRAGSANLGETQAFQDDEKRILVFSDAGGTGRSYLALGVFFTPKRRLKPAPMAHAVARALSVGQAPLPIVRPVYTSWTYQAELARRQRAAWAFAAVASAALCVGLAAALSMTISRPAVALHIIELSRPGGLSN